MQHPTDNQSLYRAEVFASPEEPTMLEQAVTPVGLHVYKVGRIMNNGDHAVAYVEGIPEHLEVPFMLYNEDHLTLVTHGSDEGEIWARHDWLETVDQIICCFPARVKARIPAIAHKVWGDWDSETRYGVQGDWLKFAPEEYWLVLIKETK